MANRNLLQGLFQHKDVSRLWSTNLRFGWLQSANTGLFVVLNEVRDADGGIRGAQARSVTLKFSHLFEVFD